MTNSKSRKTAWKITSFFPSRFSKKQIDQELKKKKFVEIVSSAKKRVLFVKYKRGIMLAEPRCAFWNLVCHQVDNAGVAGPGAAWVTVLG